MIIKEISIVILSLYSTEVSAHPKEHSALEPAMQRPTL